MPVRIRLQRHGKKGKPFYWIVAADSRAKRDGKFLEKLGIYDPNTNPATIEVKVDNSVTWLQNGAQPSDTARKILSYKGVLLKHHLLGGVRKGVLTEEQVEEKFNAWLEEKGKLIAKKEEGLGKEKAEAKAKALEAEKEVSDKRALAAVETETPEAETETPEAAKEETTEVVTETSQTEEVADAETPEVEAETVEAKEETTEAEVTETAEKAPKAEAKTQEEAPAKEEAAAETDSEEKVDTTTEEE